MAYNALSDLEVQRRRSYPTLDLWNRYHRMFQLSLRTSEATLCTEIHESDLHRPGLAMSGFTEVYSHQHIQLIGSTEWSFLEAAGPERRREIFAKLSVFRSPLWVLTHNLEPHAELCEMCENNKIPLVVTAMPTVDFARAIQRMLEEWFAPYAPVHASLVDVYGVGMLYIGASNIGKSECVLDLVERGHRLVADDVVKLVRIGNSIIGRSNSIINHHMEIRGVGIIDIRSMFGIKAVRKIKKVEIIVELQYWRGDVLYDRTGLDTQLDDVLGVQIPRVVIPVSPGKNITVISEVIAMNQLMKMDGIDAASRFNEALLDAIQRKASGADTDSLFGANQWDFYE